MEVIELSVRVDCEGCEKKVKKALYGLEGVQDVDVNRKAGKVTVKGSVSKEDVLKTVRKTGRSAEFLLPAYVIGYNPYTLEGDKFRRTHNYEENGFNNVLDPLPGPSTVLPNDGPAGVFNDENTNNCSIM